MVKIFKMYKDGVKEFWFNVAASFQGAEEEIAYELVDSGYKVLSISSGEVVVRG